MAREGFSEQETGASADPGQTLGSIGPYRILGLIGEGGFGEVYEAEQTQPVRRRVAIKIVKAGMDSAAVVARFEAERQALAVMDHTCIAKVFDGGVTPPDMGSRPYFVMELVRGEEITAFCDRARLSIDARVELFARVCEAVQHAHNKGVVHRDLKPSNILVAYDAEGHATPKVIDFGVAKALNQRLTEKTIFTERGQLIGTPEYMSPEQAEMSGVDIDTRSDVYSLGVVLYELLTGVLPFEPGMLRRAAFVEIQRIIREVEPARPSTRLSTVLSHEEEREMASRIIESRHTDARSLTSVLRRDLDWVVMRCLEKDRERRYDTANAIAVELRRYLSGEPVVAGPPGHAYRMRKFVRRHRGALAATGLVVAALLSAVSALGWGLWREAGLSAQVRREREAAFGALEFINGVVADEQGQGVGSGGERLDRVRARIEGADIGEVARSRLEWGLGQAYLGAGLTVLSEQSLRAAVRRADAQGEEGSRVAALARLALAESLYRLDRGEEAREVAAQGEAALSRSGEATKLEVLRARAALAGAIKRSGQNSDGADTKRALLERAQEMYAELALSLAQAAGPDAIETIECEYDLALVDSLLGDQEEAIARLMPLRDRLAPLFGMDSDVWIGATSELGLMKAQAGDLSGGMALYEEALEGAEWTLGGAHWRTIQIWERIGNLRYAMKDFDGAVEAFEEAIRRHAVINGEFHPKTLYVLKRLAMTRTLQGRVEEGLEPMLQIYERMKKEPRVDRVWLRTQASSIQEVMQLAGLKEDAETWGARAEP